MVKIRFPTRLELDAASSERRDEIEKSRAASAHRMHGTRPTPSQSENDLAVAGKHVDHKAVDGAPPDPHGGPLPSSVKPSSQVVVERPVQRPVERAAVAQAPSAGYQTRASEPRPNIPPQQHQQRRFDRR